VELEAAVGGKDSDGGFRRLAQLGVRTPRATSLAHARGD